MPSISSRLTGHRTDTLVEMVKNSTGGKAIQQDQTRHGFQVGGMGGDGKPPIFVHSFFPDQIVNIEPLSPSGSTITVKYDERDDPVARDVVPSVDVIKNLIERCRLLDEQDPPADGALKYGKPIP